MTTESEVHAATLLIGEMKLLEQERDDALAEVQRLKEEAEAVNSSYALLEQKRDTLDDLLNEAYEQRDAALAEVQRLKAENERLKDTSKTHGKEYHRATDHREP